MVEETAHDQEFASAVEAPSLERGGWVVLFAILVLAVVGGLIAYGGYLERAAFLKSQVAVAEKSVAAVANQIGTWHTLQQRLLRSFLQSNEGVLGAMSLGDSVASPELARLARSLSTDMPELSALVLADRDQPSIRGSVPEGIEEPLLGKLPRLLQESSGMPALLAGNSDQVYYAAAEPLKLQPGTVVVALLDARPLTKMLADSQSENHVLLLYDQDNPAEPLLASGGQAAVDYHAMTIGDALALQVIPGTQWQLADIPDQRYIRANLFQVVLLRVLIIGLMALAMMVLYLVLRKREKGLRDSRNRLLMANQQLRYKSMHDALTELPNRALLEEKIRTKIHHSNRTGERFVVMLVSLNGFQRINKNLGYDVGNKVLQQIARRLSETLRDVDSVARFEGDVFAVLADIREKPQASVIARKIVECLDHPIDVADSPLSVSSSIGVVICPDQGRSLDALIRHADSAVNLARSNGGKTVVFSAEGETSGLDRLSLITGIKDAMQSGQLSMVYQPKLSLTAPEDQGVEALLRWRHSEYGPLPCDMFIPLVEQTKHIVDLTHWTIESCFRALGKLKSLGSVPSVAVNLSARVLDEEGFPEWVEQMLERYDVNPASVRFELTESTMMHDSERAMQIMLRLSAMGIGLSVDDFGVGHSSLAYISRLPVDELKVDKSFVLNMQKWESDRAIVKATIDLAHDLGLSVVAEGVETSEQATMLREMECDVLQGYYVSRPLSEEQMLDWYASKAG